MRSDAKEGTTTGVSAKDWTNTILALVSPNSKPEDFNRPVLCEIVDDDDGSMALLPKLQQFAKRENLKIISIADLISEGGTDTKPRDGLERNS